MAWQKPVLYVWPAGWNLPSIDPTCLTVIFYLRLFMLPDEFVIVECTNPDLSPSAQLPFLVHEQQVVSSLFSIISYVQGLKKCANANSPLVQLTFQPKEMAQKAAWIAHVQANFGDLFLHAFFALQANWSGLTHPALCSMLGFPQRFYVPARLRECYKPRLEANGLWDLPGIEQEKEKEKPFVKEPSRTRENDTKKFHAVFEREKVAEKARSVFDVYNRLLGSNLTFFPGKLSDLDLMVASHTLLFLNAPLKDKLVSDVLLEYPSLVQHAQTIQSMTTGLPSSKPAVGYSLRSLVPFASPLPSTEQHTIDEAKTQEDINFERFRWGWMALSGIALAYAVSNLAMRIQMN